MVSFTDKEYIESKNIFLNKKSIKKEYIQLSDWINKTYNVKVLNLYFDTVIRAHIKDTRLQVILESTKDFNVFNKEGLHFDEKKQDEIKNKIITDWPFLIKEDKMTFFVVFGDFEKIAYEEVNKKITENELKKLANLIDPENIWTIQNFFSNIVVFYYTDKYLKKMDKESIMYKIKDLYFKILLAHDELKCVNQDKLVINFDTKENFDTKYKGNWFNYLR